MIFTPNQIDELMGILDRYTVTFIAKYVGIDILSKDDLGVLKAAGVDVSKILFDNSNVVQAFKFGLLTDAIGDNNAKGMTYDSFKKFLSSGQFFPLNETEENAILNLKNQTYSDIKGLTGKMKTDVRQELVKADKIANEVRHSSTVTSIAKKTIEHRKGVSHMASELGHMTGQWNKDLGRISDFVMHTAFDEGRAQSFERRAGKDSLVYKDVYPGACKHCIKHYLTGSFGAPPKIFKLSELKANGTNIGKKADDWLPVVGPLHPWCRCTLERLPFGFTLEDYRAGKWEWNGSIFVRVKGEQVREPKIDRPKVKVTINGKESFV